MESYIFEENKTRRFCIAGAHKVKQQISPDTPLVIAMGEFPRIEKIEEGRKYVMGTAFKEIGLSLVWEEARSTFLHEIGHLIGLEDCDKTKCVMKGVVDL